MAGGFKEEAMTTFLNQAELVTDGQKLYVPTKEEVINEHQIEGGASQDVEDGKININTATKEELMEITGIGESKAESIIQYRETTGLFQSPEDIQNITGIKGATYEKLKDEIKTN